MRQGRGMRLRGGHNHGWGQVPGRVCGGEEGRGGHRRRTRAGG